MVSEKEKITNYFEEKVNKIKTIILLFRFIFNMLCC